MFRHFFLLSAFWCVALFANAQRAQSVSILGDSYSTFEGYLQPDTNAIWYYATRQHNNDVIRVSQTWWYQLIRDMGWHLEQNNSFSGATIGFRGYNGDDYKDRSFIRRHSNLGNPDIIFIFGGTNDVWCHREPLGEYKYEAITDSDCYTFRPAMARLLALVKERYLNTAVYFILNCNLDKEYTESMKVICRKYDIPCIVLHDIDKQEGHPSVLGMQQIASQVRAFIEQ